jgi:hypothetical protein
MAKKAVLACLLLCAGASFCFAGAEPNMQEGLWEITSSMEMPGMPSMPPMKHTQCLTKKDLVPQSQEKAQDCKITQTGTSGNTVTWSMKCSGEEGAMEGTGKVTYSGDTFQGTMTMTMQDPEQGGKMQLTQRMSGRRVGNCK